MVKVFVPDESEIPLKWASEKASIASFLMSYCRNKFPDNQEYIERYTACYDKWSAEYKKIIEKDREILGLSAGEFLAPSESGDFYTLSNPSEKTLEYVNSLKYNRLRHKQMIESNNLADMAMPITDEKAVENNDNRRLQNMTFQVTESCNLRCTYCYQINKAPNSMTFETAKRMVDYILSDAYTANRPNMMGFILEFIGGEPFLEVELMDQIIEYFYDQCITRDLVYAYHTRISISSNGTLYFTEPVQKFIRKYSRVLSLGISVDGNKELHDSCRLFPDGTGSYDTAIAACYDYKMKYGALPGSKMTLAHANLDYIKDAVISLMDNGYDEINLNCVYEDDWEDGDAAKMYYQLKSLADFMIEKDRCLSYWVSIFRFDEFRPQDKVNDTQNYCGGNGVMIALDYKGDIYPCIRFMKSSLGPKVEPIVIGDLNVGIAGNTVYKNKYNDLLSITRQSQSTDTCINCPISQGCGWCTGYNYQTFGTPNHRATFICDMHKARALANGYMWNKYFLEKDLPYVFHNYIPKEWAIEIIGEDEYNMLIGLEQEIIFSDKNDGREIYMVNYGTFGDDDTNTEPWMDLQPKDN